MKWNPLFLVGYLAVTLTLPLHADMTLITASGAAVATAEKKHNGPDDATWLKIQFLLDFETNAEFTRTVTDHHNETLFAAHKHLESGVEASLERNAVQLGVLTNNDGIFYLSPEKAFFLPPENETFVFSGTLAAGKEILPSYYCQFNNLDVFIANLAHVITKDSDPEAFEKLNDMANEARVAKLQLQKEIREAMLQKRAPSLPKTIRPRRDRDGFTLRDGKWNSVNCLIVNRQHQHHPNAITPDTVTDERWYYDKKTWLPLGYEKITHDKKLLHPVRYSDYTFDVPDALFDTPSMSIEACASRNEADAARRDAFYEFNNKGKTAARVVAKTKSQFKIGMTTWIPIAAGGGGLLALVIGLAMKYRRR